MTCLIETDVLGDFCKHQDPAKGLREKRSRTTTFALSTLTITELRSGWTGEQADFLLPRLSALGTVVPVTKEIAEQAGKWREEYQRQGVSLGTPDTVIAATAYLHHYPLLTKNAKDYPMPELTLDTHTPATAAETTIAKLPHPLSSTTRTYRISSRPMPAVLTDGDRRISATHQLCQTAYVAEEASLSGRTRREGHHACPECSRAAHAFRRCLTRAPLVCSLLEYGDALHARPGRFRLRGAMASRGA